MNIKIIPLSKKYLEEAIKTISAIFPEQDEEENVETCFRASLDIQKYKPMLKKWNIPKIEYFLAIDKDANKVAGSSGIYEMEKDKKTVWIGWTAVTPDYRRKGIGKMLVSHSIDESKKRGYKQMKLHTVDNEHQKNAHKLYESVGFRLFKLEKKREIGYDRRYYKMEIK